LSRYTAGRRRLHGIAPAIVLVAASGAAIWLYRQTPVGAGVHAVAEAREYTVAPAESGRLASLQAAPGQRVLRGQVLALMERDLLEQQMKVAEAELSELAAEAKARGRDLDVDRIEMDRQFGAELEKAVVALEEARNDCAKTRAEFVGIQAEMQRQRDLVQRHLTPSERLHELQLRAASLEQVVAACPGRLEAIENHSRSAEQRISSLEATRGRNDRLAADKLEPLRLRANRQRELLRLFHLRLEKSVLRAPVDGCVVSLGARPGHVLSAGDPVAVIVEEHPRQIIAYVEEERVLRVVSGDRVVIRPRDRTGAEGHGTVTGFAGTVTQMPARFWPTPTRPRWARQAFIQVESEGALTAGEAFEIAFVRNEENSPWTLSASRR
jgi:multidrug resistance efflux pump